MNRIKFYKTLVILLILLNLGTLFSMWYNRPPNRGRPNHHHLTKILNLEGDAKESVNALATTHHVEKKGMVLKDQELHSQLYLLIGENGNPTNILEENQFNKVKTATDLLEEIHFNKVKIEVMTFEYFDEVGQYCNKEQLKTLKEFIKKALNNLSGPRRKGPPGRR